MNEFKPYIVSWNLTKSCNLSCPHCYINSVARLKSPQSELSTDEAMFVIDELSYINGKLMLVLSGGEPLLRKDIYEIIGYAASGGFIPVLGTNGTLLTEDTVRLLKEAGLRGVGVSIDSLSPEGHDRFRGRAGAWDLSISGLRYAREKGIETQMDITLTDQNWKDIDSFIEFGTEIGVKAINFFFIVCTGRALKTDISRSNYEHALQHLSRRIFSEKRLMVRARCAPHIYRILYEEGYSIPSGTRGCLAGRSYMRIDPEGYVTPCPYMDMKAGNIKEHSLSKIWNESPVFSSLREGKYLGRCSICEYTEICGGCRARALVDRGDMIEEDTLCSYIPSGKERVFINPEIPSDLHWDERAKERIKNVPTFMQGVIVRVIEAKAGERGITTITSEFIDELKGFKSHHGISK